MAGRKQQTTPGITLSDATEGLSSGYGVIDVVSGVPGVLFPKATIVEVFGQKSSSKTTLVLETIAYNQMINPKFRVLYADFERMLRKQTPYIEQLGVHINDDFVVISPTTMEEGCEEILNKIRDDHFDMVVVDTVAAMRPAVELEKGFAQNKQMGVRGKNMSEFLRNLMADLPSDGPAIVFINQMYKDINNSSFIQMYTTPASDSLAFYAGMRIEVKETTKLKEKVVNPYTLEEEDAPVGSVISIVTRKNKVGKPFLSSKYVITYGWGIDIIPSVITAAQRAGVLQTKGNSKSSFIVPYKGEEKSIVGMSRLIKFFEENPEALVEVGSKINHLWAKDLTTYVDRMARKTRTPKGFISDVQYEVDESSAEGLELEGESQTGEGAMNLTTSEIPGEEAPSADIGIAFSATPATLKSYGTTPPSGSGFASKFKV